MMTLPPSESSSAAYAKLDERVQRWIHGQGWNSLRNIQIQAIHAILDGDQDLIITATTAGGKTEAAFLPIFSRLANEDQVGGFRAVYLAPLKALINDQFRRLEELGAATGISVTRWHGDVSATAKLAARKTPQGVLLITPESLEALFVIRGREIPRLFAPLEFVVIDELHAFIGTERGVQLQSLLARLETALQRRSVRIGLSATLGEPELAKSYLRQPSEASVRLIEGRSEGGKELLLQLRGATSTSDELDISLICNHIFDKLRGKSNLVFAGSRARVELVSDALAKLATNARVPNEFFPHHGSLSKELREMVEQRLREGELPTTAVCTTTLELGIDIGKIESVAQIGPPASIAALRQRLGRSGRRGAPAILRIYIQEHHLHSQSSIPELLRIDLVQAVAAIRLLFAGWCEPPISGALHLSTMVHQILALIAQRGGISPLDSYRLLCVFGPFRAVDSMLFKRVLSSMARRELIEQSQEGLLLLGKRGEYLVDDYKFYAVFKTPDEFRVLAQGRQIGQLPVDHPMVIGDYLIFAGRRWQIDEVDQSAKVILVTPAPAGKVPMFVGSEGVPLHDRLVAEMRQVYLDGEVPDYLDANAKQLLAEGYSTWRQYDLAKSPILGNGRRSLLLSWVGGRKLLAMQLSLLAEGIPCQLQFPVLHVELPEGELLSVLARLANAPPPDPLRLAEKVPVRQREKFHDFLDDDLLLLEWATSVIDATSVPVIAERMVRESNQR